MIARGAQYAGDLDEDGDDGNKEVKDLDKVRITNYLYVLRSFFRATESEMNHRQIDMLPRSLQTARPEHSV